MKKKKFGPSAIRGFFIMILMLIFIPYVFIQRAWTSVFFYSFMLAIPSAFNLALREVGYKFNATQTSWTKFNVGIRAWRIITFFIFLWAIILAPFSALLYGLIAFVVDSLRWLITTLPGREASTTIGVIGTLAAGISLFLFRLHFRCIYGASEFLVGLMVAGLKVSTESNIVPDAGLLLAVLTAGAYLVVRGLDNIHQGWKAQSDPIANYLIRLTVRSSKSHPDLTEQ